MTAPAACPRVFHGDGALPEVDPRRPLIVSDVDEVVLRFVAALEDWLGGHGLWLARDSFALNGNVRRGDGTAVGTDELRALLHGFFDSRAHDLSPVAGAVEALTALSAHAGIVFLSNLPAASAPSRRANLDRLGLSQPLIANEGPKGPTLARLAARVAAPVIFLDDSPGHIDSAREAAPQVATVHFVADAAFRDRVVPRGDIGLFTGDWGEATRYITALVSHGPFTSSHSGET